MRFFLLVAIPISQPNFGDDRPVSPLFRRAPYARLQVRVLFLTSLDGHYGL
jgi:hypothetical protein